MYEVSDIQDYLQKWLEVERDLAINGIIIQPYPATDPLPEKPIIGNVLSYGERDDLQDPGGTWKVPMRPPSLIVSHNGQSVNYIIPPRLTMSMTYDHQLDYAPENLGMIAPFRLILYRLISSFPLESSISST